MSARAVGAFVAAFAVLGGTAAAQQRPPDNPGGAAVTLAATSVPSGGEVAFAGTGFVRERGGGQVVTVKLDDGAIVGAFTADAGGAVSGAVPVVAAAGAHWLRFLAGSGGPSGQSGGEPPARSLTADLEVTAAPGAPAPAPAAKLAVSVGAVTLAANGRRATLDLRCPATNTSCSGSIALRARRGGWRVARTTYALAGGQSTREPLRLTRRARRVLHRTGRLAVSARVTTVGAGTTARAAVLGG